MSTEKTQVNSQESSSRIEAPESGGLSMAAPAFSLSAGAGAVGPERTNTGPVQMLNELTPEQIAAAIQSNTAFNLEPISIRTLQFTIGAAVTGVWDNATITAINTLAAGSLGVLNAAAFGIVFTRMVAANQHARLIPLALDYLNLTNADFITADFVPAATYTYRVQVPFSTLQLDSSSASQVLTDAPNRLKNVSVGPGAMLSPATFTTAITAVNAVQYQTTAAPTTTAETAPTTTTATANPQLTATQSTAAISFNNFVLSDALPRRIFQAAIGTAQSGVFDSASVQALSDYQRRNTIANTDGRIDRATLDHIIRYMITQGQRDAVLRVAGDFFNFDALLVNIVIRYNSGTGATAGKNTEIAGVESYTLGDTAFANGLDGLGTALDSAIGAGTSMNTRGLDVATATTATARRNAMWSNPDAANEAGLVPWIRENFPTEAQLAAFLGRQDLTQEQKLAAFGLFSVELGRLEFLMGVIYHGGVNQSWENLNTANTNRGTFVNHYKAEVGNGVNQSPWCTMFAGYLRTLLGFRDDLADGGPLIFNAGIRLDYWATNNRNYISGQDDFTSPNDFQNYSGTNVDTPAWIQLRTNVNAAQGAAARQQAVDTFFTTNPVPQPGDILVINTGTTTNAYGGNSSNESHTVNVESYSNRTISTIEGNRGQKVTGVTLDLTNPAHVGQCIVLVRAGIELYTENQAAPAPAAGETAPAAPSQEDILRPLRQMVRNLQLIADHKDYIESNVAGATVASMSGNNAGNGTQ